MNKLLVEVSEALEDLQLSMILVGWPISNSGYFNRIHFNLIL